LNNKKRKPDFINILKILKKEKPERETLFEFIICEEICKQLAGYEENSSNLLPYIKMLITAYLNAGYDFFPIGTWLIDILKFPRGESHEELSRSQNEGALITDWESYEKYQWPNPNSYDYDIYKQIGNLLSDGMKLIACGPGGVLENATDIVGYENLCIISLTDEALTKEICDSIGSRLLTHYENVSSIEAVGAIIGNDDWGFKTQTMFSTDMLRKFIFPWHKKFVEAAHRNNKPAILHSCGNLSEVMGDVTNELKYDGKHSFEDQIISVEEAYDTWGESISILGGIDVDFIVRSSPELIYKRSKEMLERAQDKGGFALGSGNSITNYVPFENYLAMIKAAKDI